MRRLWIVLLSLAMALVIAVPATAKKPPEPNPDPAPATTYEATIERTSDNGVDTTCIGPIVVTRTDERRGAVTHFESGGAQLNLIAGLTDLPDACHGETIVQPDPEPDDYVLLPEYFRITFDGGQIAMLWIFDVGIEETVVIHPKSGKACTEESRTDHSLFSRWRPFADSTAHSRSVDLSAQSVRRST